LTKKRNKYLTNYFPNAIRQETPLGRAYKDPTDESDNPFLAISVTTILGLVLLMDVMLIILGIIKLILVRLCIFYAKTC